MKISKFVSAVLALLGTLLMAGTAVLCLVSLKAEPKLLQVSDAARERAVDVMDAVCAGDYEAAGSMMYGQPDLGAGREPADEVGAPVWEAFVESLSYELKGEPTATDSGIAWTVQVEALDISSVTVSLQERAEALLQQRAEQAEDMSEVYDEDNNFREDVVAQVLCEAVAQALAEDAVTVSREASLNLICQDGQWWVAADQALLQAISGGVA